MDGSEVLPPADGIPEAAPAAVSASTLSSGAAGFVPGMANVSWLPEPLESAHPMALQLHFQLRLQVAMHLLL